MKTNLDHLPEQKQRELTHVVRVLFEEFSHRIAGATQPWKTRGRVLRVILYGSYARGDWVDDPVGGYRSDYDLLVIVNDERLTDVVEYWSTADDRLMREMTIYETLSAPVSFIVHSLDDVNGQLSRGRPFFRDIVEQGVTLYEAEGIGLANPRKLPPAEARAEAQAHFQRLFSRGSEFLAQAAFAAANARQNIAAFEYHQSTEQFYHCTMLVLTLYSPKSHKLNFLRGHAEDIAPELTEAWPREDKFSRRCFELLRLAYVNARYSQQFSVTGEELAWIAERVLVLQKLVKTVCERRLSET